MNLARLFALTAERIPGKLALAEGADRRTYGDWAADVYALGNSFRELGMDTGDRVVIIMANSVAHATATAATIVAGGVSVPFNVRSAPATMAQVIRDSGAGIVVLDDDATREELVRTGLGRDEVRWVVASDADGADALDLSQLVASGARMRPAVDLDDRDLANILYTSGTTGIPKGIPHHHHSIYERVVAWTLHFGPVASGGVRTLGIAPLYHITGFHCVFWLTIAENGSYHVPVDRSPAALLRLVETDRLTYISAPPILLERLVAAASEDRYDLSSVNTVVPGSAPRPPTLLDGLRKTFSFARFGEAYGTSEGVMFGAVDLFDKLGAFQVIGDMEARVIRPGGMPDEVVADDAEGELIVSMESERIIPTYWNRPVETAERFRHGWSYTGDAARRDPEGDIWIVGRLDDIFISGAENIQPTEVEWVLDRHPGIADCAVVGTPDVEWGELCTAFVVLADQALGVDDLDRYCREHPELANFKRPRRYVFVSDVERNATGKIPRREYRQRWIDGDFDTVEPTS